MVARVISAWVSRCWRSTSRKSIVELIAAKDDVIIDGTPEEVGEILPDGVRRSSIPGVSQEGVCCAAQ